MPRLWLCADDYGISPAVNVGIRDLIVRERLNATSVLVVAPSCRRSEAVLLDSLNRTGERIAIGLHLALTAPFRPSSSAFTPLRDGTFLPLAGTLCHAFLRRFSPAALLSEITAQMERFSWLFGRLPDFIDGHHHVHLLPQIRDAVLLAAAQRTPNLWIRQCARPARRSAPGVDYKGWFLSTLSRTFRRRAAAISLRTNPAFAGTYDFVDDADFAALFPRFIDDLPEGSVVMCHPGFADSELQRLDQLTTLREREYAFLASDAFPALLAARSITLG
jgi:predicted glycoside hydrolase/deacetylase ChbG (UPF0249 family)